MENGLFSKITARTSVCEQDLDQTYTHIYADGFHNYWVKSDMWDQFTKLVDLVSPDVTNLGVYQVTASMSVIPTGGVYIYSLVVMYFKCYPSLNSVKDVFDAFICDQQSFMRVIEELNKEAKTKSLSTEVAKQVDQIAEKQSVVDRQLTTLRAEVDRLNQELARKEQIYEQEKVKHREDVERLKEALDREINKNVIEATADWVELSTNPDYKAMPTLKRLLVSSKGTKRIQIREKFQINVSEEVNEEDEKFLRSFGHYALEFICVKMPYLIPYIRKYILIQKKERM